MVRRQPPDAFDEAIEELRDVGRDRDVEVRRLAGQPSPIRDGHPCRDLAARLDIDVERLGRDQASGRARPRRPADRG